MQSAVCSNCRSRSSYPADDTKNASPLSQWAAYNQCAMLFLKNWIVPLIGITCIDLGIRGSRLWIIILIAVEVPNNVLDMIWHIITPSALHCIHRAMCTMNEAAPFVPGANDIMKRGFSRSEWYVDRPHVPKLQSRLMQKKSRKSSVKKTQK